MKITKLKRILSLLMILGLVGILVTSCEREIIGDELDGFKTDIVEDELDGFRELPIDLTDQILYSIPNHMQNKTESEIQSFIQNLSESELEDLIIEKSDLNVNLRAKCTYIACVHIGGTCEYANLLNCFGQMIWFCTPLCTG